MLDLGVHLLDAIGFLLGAPTLVAASARTIVQERPGMITGEPVDVDDWSWAEVALPDGAHLTVEASRIALGAEGTFLELYGTAGSLQVDLGLGRLELRRLDGDQTAYRRRAAEDHLVRTVAALRPPPRLSLGAFVDSHAAGLHHALLRVAGEDPAPELAPTLHEAAAAEALAHEIVDRAFAARGEGGAIGGRRTQ